MLSEFAGSTQVQANDVNPGSEAAKIAVNAPRRFPSKPDKRRVPIDPLWVERGRSCFARSRTDADRLGSLFDARTQAGLVDSVSRCAPRWATGPFEHSLHMWIC